MQSTSGQPVLSVETDKAAMEVESDVDGTVSQILVKPGDKIPDRYSRLQILTAAGKSESPKRCSASKGRASETRSTEDRGTEASGSAIGRKVRKSNFVCPLWERESNRQR